MLLNYLNSNYMFELLKSMIKNLQKNIQNIHLGVC